MNRSGLATRLSATRRNMPSPISVIDLNCTNCHLDGGLNPNAASFVGLAAVYPEYRARSGRVNTLADRVNECFERSLNGRALPADSSKLQAVVAYITWLSRGVPNGATLPWRGLQRIESRRPLNPANGKQLFASNVCSVTDLTGWGPWQRRRSGDRNPTLLAQAWRG